MIYNKETITNTKTKNENDESFYESFYESLSSNASNYDNIWIINNYESICR